MRCRVIRSGRLWWVFAVALFSGTSLGQTDIADERITPAVAAAVDDLVESGKLAGAVTLVAQEGEILHLQAHGLRSLESGDPMTTDSIFRIHSFTKAIVSAAALQLFDQGKYRLEDPVSEYLPAFESSSVSAGPGGNVRPAKNPIRVVDLFRHTSGLPYGFTAPPHLVPAYSSPGLWGGDLDRFCEELAALPLVHEPGEGWVYGVGIDVLGKLIEVWSDRSLDQYLADEFFKPLGMKDTGFWVETGSKRERFASVHQSTPKGVKPGNDPLGQSYVRAPRLLSGGGGLVSTAADYFAFLRMIANGGSTEERVFLKPETVALMTTDQLPTSIPHISFGEEERNEIGFGLGFSVVTGKSVGWDEAAKIKEYGWGGAASCHYWISPEDDDLVVITLEQTVPYNWNLERALKPIIYGAVRMGK